VSPRRVVWISQADELSAAHGAPANALLKLLEEPRPSSILLLTTTRPEALMPTIRSRCQHFRYTLSREEREKAPITESLAQELTAEGWGPFLEWIQAGAPEGSKWSCPADSDAFWKQRALAVERVQELRAQLWHLAKPYWSQWDRHSA